MITYENHGRIIKEFNRMIRNGHIDDNLKYVDAYYIEPSQENNIVYYNVKSRGYKAEVVIASDGTTLNELDEMVNALMRYKYCLETFRLLVRYGLYDSTQSIYQSRLDNLDWVLTESELNKYNLLQHYTTRTKRANEKRTINSKERFKEYLNSKGAKLSIFDKVKIGSCTLFCISENPLREKLHLDDLQAINLWSDKAYQYIMENIKIAVLLNYQDVYKHLIDEEELNGETYYKLKNNSMQEINDITKGYVQGLKVLEYMRV